MSSKFNLIDAESKLSEDLKPYVTFPIINECNLACRYCGDGGEMSISKMQKFDPDDLFNWFHAARKLGIEKFRITGGEPLLHPDFADILSEISKTAKLVLVNTNGTLVAQRQDKWKDAAPNNIFVVNYHGASQAVFESVCGKKGVYKAVREGIEMLAAKKLLHRLNIVICEKNYYELFDVIDYCRSLGCDLKIQDVVRVPWQITDWNSIYYYTTEIERE
jgi:molybdenum cofactor biosynthesis enzyme MoaA